MKYREVYYRHFFIVEIIYCSALHEAMHSLAVWTRSTQVCEAAGYRVTRLQGNGVTVLRLTRHIVTDFPGDRVVENCSALQQGYSTTVPQ